MSINYRLFHIFILQCILFQINSQSIPVIAKSVQSVCDTNLYKIIINIKIVQPLEEYKNFYFNAENEQKELLFKCIIDPVKSQIICITNLEQQKIFLNAEDTITLPYPLPNVDGIHWDYPSFVTLVYRRIITINEGCGKTVLKSNLYKVNPSKWDLLTKINKIYNGQCLLSDSSDNYYSFKLNMRILGGNLFDTLSSNAKTKITLLQNITMPFILGSIKIVNSLDNYISHAYYKSAFCYSLEEITSNNYLKESGFDFKCNILLYDQHIFNGPLKVWTFSDNIYAQIEKNNEKVIDYISIYFSTEKNPKVNKNFDDNSEEPGENIETKNDDDNDDDEDEDENDNDNEDDNNDSKNNNNNDDEKEEEDNNKIEKEKEKEKKEEIEDEEEEENIPKGSSSSSKSSSPSSSSSFKPSSSSSSLKPSSSPSSSSSSNLRQNEEKAKKKNSNPDYLLLDNKKVNFLCPDTPLFEIINIKDGISYEPIQERDDEFNIILTGYLSNGFKIVGKKVKPLEYTTEDINFNLSIINNLAEKISDKKRDIYCSINSGTMFLRDELAKIKCVGQKLDQSQKQNTDLSINWASKENKYLKNILIKWPKDYNDITVHSKKLYSYEIYAFSIQKTDYDCFDDKFYFYVDILDINSETNINFNISMLSPDKMPAQCKLYTSESLRCFLDLRLKKLSKGTKIRLPLPGNYNISTDEGNYINFTIFNFIDENNTEVPDEGIIVEETCGHNVLVGAIQGIGYNHISAVIIIICAFVTIGVITVFIIACLTLEITTRTKQGYYPHVEENVKKDIKNDTSNVTKSDLPVNTTQNATGMGLEQPKV